MGYDDIRKALENFGVDNLHSVTRLGHELLTSDSPLQHPAAVYVVAVTAQRIALYWDGVPVAEESASVVEAHLRPKMLAVLDAAETDAQHLLDTLDDLARAYVDSVPFLKKPSR